MSVIVIQLSLKGYRMAQVKTGHSRLEGGMGIVRERLGQKRNWKSKWLLNA